MKKMTILAGIIGCAMTLNPSCKKKESGVCYCSYLSGDKKEYNLSSLTRSKQVDSCYVLDGYAEGFAGDCKLK